MKINVIKFGPIENASIQLAPMTIFTGNSNLGKSYVNYLAYFVMRYISFDELVLLFDSKKSLKDEFTMPIADLQSWLHEKVVPFMREFLNAPDITCDVTFDLLPTEPNKSFHFKYEEHQIQNQTEDIADSILRERKVVKVILDGSVHELIVPRMMRGKGTGLALAFSQYLQEILFGKTINQAIILPPARGAFVGENYTLKEKIASSVGMYRKFMNDYDYATQYLALKKRDANHYAEQIERLIDGKLISREGKQYLVLKNGKELPLSAAASSIKELSPLLYALQGGKRTFSFCIEEPEAHLHPQMQVAMVDLLANCFNDGMMFQLTTHSDYVMQRLNQLIKLESIRKSNKQKFDEVCNAFGLSERHCIKKEDVKVYYFEASTNGKVTIEDLIVTDDGFPMMTFFEVVHEMTKIEDVLNNVIETINEGGYNGDEE